MNHSFVISTILVLCVVVDCGGSGRISHSISAASDGTIASGANDDTVAQLDGAEFCDASNYDDGGACAPHWTNGGNGCSGGDVLFPCGLPPAPGTTARDCARYCLGTPFALCKVTNLDLRPNTPSAPWTVDAGTYPIVVYCYNPIL